MQEIVDSQPESTERDIVIEHLKETRFVVQIVISGASDSDWEFELLTFMGGIGFFAEAKTQAIVFYEFGGDDLLQFRSAQYFERTT